MFGEAVPLEDAELEEYTFVEGDTISGVAYRFGVEWRQIAERNRIVDVRNISPGTRLLIPAKELERGLFESV